jgi:hypothetical protein
LHARKPIAPLLPRSPDLTAFWPNFDHGACSISSLNNPLCLTSNAVFGFISLTEWQGTGLAFVIEQHNRSVRTRLLQRLKALQAKAFEELIGELLAPPEVGFEPTIRLRRINSRRGVF